MEWVATMSHELDSQDLGGRGGAGPCEYEGESYRGPATDSAPAERSLVSP
jgi:hypothetical protein